MSYFVTGATGFIGRHLVQELLDNRQGEVFVLVRKSSKPRLEALLRTWGDEASRVTPVVGDLGKPNLGMTKAWVAEHRGSIDHFFHLAAIYDMTASSELNEQLNVGGTREAIGLAEALDAGVFHQVSSVASAGDYHGTFDETMFDVGQGLPSPYHRTKFESERIVREECTVPWRVYRPAVVVGHSETGAMDKIDGPYYFFPLFKRMRDALPSWVPVLGVDLGDTNVVPVDYVAKAMDHIAHQPGHDGEAFHLVNPEPQPTVEVVNTFAAASFSGGSDPSTVTSCWGAAFGTQIPFRESGPAAAAPTVAPGMHAAIPAMQIRSPGRISTVQVRELLCCIEPLPSYLLPVLGGAAGPPLT